MTHVLKLVFRKELRLVIFKTHGNFLMCRMKKLAEYDKVVAGTSHDSTIETTFVSLLYNFQGVL